MIGKVVGALFGAEMERKRGQSPVKGAIVGTLAAATIRRLGPLGIVLGGAYVAKKAYDRHRETKDASPGPAA